MTPPQAGGLGGCDRPDCEYCRLGRALLALSEALQTANARFGDVLDVAEAWPRRREQAAMAAPATLLRNHVAAAYRAVLDLGRAGGLGVTGGEVRTAQKGERQV